MVEIISKEITALSMKTRKFFKINRVNKYKTSQLKDMVKLFYTIALLSSLTGCVGVGAFYPSNIECTYKEDGSSFDKNGKENLWCKSFVKKEQILSRYGKPKKIEQINQNEEKWLYKKDGFRWVGIMPMVILPIPIGIPISNKYEYFYFKNDVLFKKNKQFTAFDSSWCGFVGGRLPMKNNSPKPLYASKEIEWWGCASE
jgi:hypothetical protein